MEWLQWVGSINEWQVSCAKEPYERDCILQESLIIWSILLTVATPYWADKAKLPYVKSHGVMNELTWNVTEYFDSRVVLISKNHYWADYMKSPLTLLRLHVESGEDAEDALSCRSLSAKEPLIIGLFCGKWPIKIRHPITLCHSAEILKTQPKVSSMVIHPVEFVATQILYEITAIVDWVATQITTAYCIWSVISSFSNLNRWFSSPGLLYHVVLKSDPGDSAWGLIVNDIPNAIGCIWNHCWADFDF